MHLHNCAARTKLDVDRMKLDLRNVSPVARTATDGDETTFWRLKYWLECFHAIAAGLP